MKSLRLKAAGLITLAGLVLGGCSGGEINPSDVFGYSLQHYGATKKGLIRAGSKLLDLKKTNRGSFKRGTWVWDSDNYQSYQYGYEEIIDNVEALENSEISPLFQ